MREGGDSMGILATIVLVIVAVLTLMLGMAGVILPGLPGVPIMWVVVAIDYWLLGYLELSAGSMLMLSVLAAATLIIDYLATSLGVKKRGGSTWGIAGTLVGMVSGLIIFNVPGMLAGCFLGAFVGELIHGKTTLQASSIALGSLLGYAVATAFKLAAWLLYAVIIFYNIFA